MPPNLKEIPNPNPISPTSPTATEPKTSVQRLDPLPPPNSPNSPSFSYPPSPEPLTQNLLLIYPNPLPTNLPITKNSYSVNKSFSIKQTRRITQTSQICNIFLIIHICQGIVVFNMLLALFSSSSKSLESLAKSPSLLDRPSPPDFRFSFGLSSTQSYPSPLENIMCAPLTCKEEKKRRKLKDSQLNAKCLTSGQSCDNMSNNYVFHSIIQVDYHTPALSNRSIQLLCLIPKESKYICNKVNRNIIVSNRVKPKQKLVSQRHLRSTYGYSVYIVNIGTGVVLLLTTTCLRVVWSS